MLKIFNFIYIWFVKQDIQKRLKQRHLKMKRKKDNKFLTFRSWDLNPRFSVIFPPTIWIFIEGEDDEIKSRQGSWNFLTLNSSQNLTWEMERACIPSNLGPPDAIVEQVELCLEGPAIAGRLELRRAATSSGSQWRTTVIRPLLSMIFQDGIWSCRPSVYRVSQTIVGMASITARNKIFFQYLWEILWKNGRFYIFL